MKKYLIPILAAGALALSCCNQEETARPETAVLGQYTYYDHSITPLSKKSMTIRDCSKHWLNTYKRHYIYIDGDALSEPLCVNHVIMLEEKSPDNLSGDGSHDGWQKRYYAVTSCVPTRYRSLHNAYYVTLEDFDGGSIRRDISILTKALRDTRHKTDSRP